MTIKKTAFGQQEWVFSEVRMNIQEKLLVYTNCGLTSEVVSELEDL